MKSQSQYATQILAGLLVTSALALSACGAVKSGFKSDPLSGNEHYQQMRKDGVPANQVPAATPSSGASGVTSGVTSGTHAPVPSSTAVNSLPTVPSVGLPQVTDAPVTTEVQVYKLTLPEVALPETQVINFVEGLPLKYVITIVNSKGLAVVEGKLPAGLKLTPVQGDIYELTWTAPVGFVKTDDANSVSFTVNVANKSHYALAIAVAPNKNVPFVRKISLNAAEINLGDAVGFDVILSANKKLDASQLKLVLDNDDSSSDAVQAVVNAADLKAPVLQDDGTYLVHGAFETKTLPSDSKAKLNLSFYVSAVIGEKSSAQISQTISVNPIAKAADGAKADSTKAKIASVKAANKKTVK